MALRGGLAWLCTEAALPAELEKKFEKEELSLQLLGNAKLPERREMLRSLGLTYGQIIAVNRAVEEWVRYGSDEDAEDEEDGDVSDADDGSGGNDDIDNADDADEAVAQTGSAENATSSQFWDGASEHASPSAKPITPNKARREITDDEFELLLETASRLLADASFQTVRGLQIYLGNVASAPDKVSDGMHERGRRHAAHPAAHPSVALHALIRSICSDLAFKCLNGYAHGAAQKDGQQGAQHDVVHVYVPCLLMAMRASVP
eukprot:6199514-Pleurochrysis_carterae.AAC.1